MSTFAYTLIFFCIIALFFFAIFFREPPTINK